MSTPQKPAIEQRATAIFDQALNDHHKMVEEARKQLTNDFAAASALIIRTLCAGGRLFVCGNGGSAADAQHFVAELVGMSNPLAAYALTVDTSVLTALANDHGYEQVFAHQLKALATPNDCLIAISTSGRSNNVLEALTAASNIGMHTIGLTGHGAKLFTACEVCLHAPSMRTDRIQEMHGLLLHSLWDVITDHFDLLKLNYEPQGGH